jgi:DeoR/GlpR family transcriptional regulator of sugar metabolism
VNEQSSILSAERKQRILDRLRASGRVLASDLTATLGVSDDTVRRDLRDLAAAGLLQRVHGGALLPTPAHATFAERRERHVAEKARLAESAVRLFRDGLTVIVDGGTTNVEIARRIPRDLRLTVVTNSPPVALALAEHPGVETIVVGGRLDRETLSAVGTTAAREIAAVNADLLILGVCSVHP